MGKRTSAVEEVVVIWVPKWYPKLAGGGAVRKRDAGMARAHAPY